MPAQGVATDWTKTSSPISSSERAQKWEQVRKDREEREQREKLEASGLPQRHIETAKDGRRWGVPGYQQSVAKAKTACEHGGMVALVGSRGTGKTQVAVEVAMAHSGTKSVRYVKSRVLGMHLREAFDNPKLTEREALEKWVRPHLLIVDDCHELADDKQYDRSMLTLLADLRYDKCRPTLLIANVAVEKAGAMFGPSIADRLNDGGGMIAFAGQSLRGAKRGKDQPERDGGAAKP